jgi:macrolide transport system ATP-binding/permease protein
MGAPVHGHFPGGASGLTMRWPSIILLRARSLFERQSMEQELDEELRYHVERQIEEDIAAGMSREAARRAALLSVSGLTQRKEECRDMRGWNLLDNLTHDVRFALRQLRKNSGFTCTAILMLALGLCASVSIFAFVDAALFKSLPYRDPNRLVGVYESVSLCPQCNLSYLDYLDWKKLNQVFSSFDVYQKGGFSLRTNTGSEMAAGLRVSAGFFRTLGVIPVLGRDFVEGEDQPASTRTVMLSYTAWQQRYGGNRDVLGKTVTLNGLPNIVVGVLPRDFHFAPGGEPEFWTAMHPAPGCFDRRGCHNIYGLARLKDRVSLQTASANILSIAQQLERQYPDSNRGQSSNVTLLTDVIVGNIRPILLVLLSGAGLLLLIASVNVASLLVVRSESRRREIAVRSGLGASRGRLMSQFVTEGLVLMLAGAGLGLLAAHWSMALLTRLIPRDMMVGMPYLRGLGFNLRVVGFACGVSLFAAALFTLIPASRISLADLRASLSEGSRGSAGTIWRRLGSNLVVLELATAVVLLVGAGLLSKSLYRVLQVDLGMHPDHLATLQMAAPNTAYSKDEQSVALARQVVSRIGSLPGVESAALVSTLPVVGGNTVWIQVVGRPDNGEHNETSWRVVSPAYFSTIRARLIRGRYMTEQDDASKPHVVVIDQSLSKKYFPTEDPIGKWIVYKDSGHIPMQVIGVVADIKEGALDKATWPALYVALSQEPENAYSIVVRSSQDEQALLPAMAAALRQIDPSITTSNAISMSDLIGHSPAAYLRSSSAWLVGGFAVMALVLGIIGLYGVIAYSVSQRTREIGVRIALGAQAGSVYQLILKEAGRLIVLGILIGLACSIAAATLMQGLLFGVEYWDVRTLAMVAVLLGVSGMIATFLPARRAASVNPVEALRAE